MELLITSNVLTYFLPIEKNQPHGGTELIKIMTMHPCSCWDSSSLVWNKEAATIMINNAPNYRQVLSDWICCL